MGDKKTQKVLQHLSHAVNIVTTKLGDTINGFTASWMMQCAAEPPSVAIAVKKTHRSYEMIRRANCFAVNVLASGQKYVAEHFFGPPERFIEKFEGFPYREEKTGSPILEDAMAYLDCKLLGSFEFGDHAIFVGEVVAADQARDEKPLHLDECGWTYTG
jgi:flavin reductase (DIM6/NTAB) family NADH-FMN oxidoreductase RutF